MGAKHLLFNPIRDDNTEDVEGEFDGHELTSRCMASCFGRPDRSDGVQDASANAIENTS